VFSFFFFFVFFSLLRHYQTQKKPHSGPFRTNQNTKASKNNALKQKNQLPRRENDQKLKAKQKRAAITAFRK